MPQITLVPWSAEEAPEGRTPLGFAGPVVSCLRAPLDGNSAGCGLLQGQNDSNSLRGYQWRVAGSGAAFSWANRAITSVLLQAYLNNGGPTTRTEFAFYSANEPLTYAEEIFNGEVGVPVGGNLWLTLINGAHDLVKAALLANNYLFSCIIYNHSVPETTGAGIDAVQLVVTYVDLIKPIIPPLEF